MTHDAGILSGRSHCCSVYIEVNEIFARCTRPLQHTPKVEVSAGTGAQVVHVILSAEVIGHHYPKYLGALDALYSSLPPIVIGGMSSGGVLL